MNYGKKSTAKKRTALISRSSMMGKRARVSFIRVLFVSLIALCIAVTCLGVGSFRGVIDTAPDVDDIDIMPLGYATFLYDDAGNQIRKLAAPDSNRLPVTLDQIPVDLQHAVVAIEDERFYEHNGIDVKGILRAGMKALTTGDFSEGASTITQQLLKNNVFTNWTSESTQLERFTRKIQEQYLAVQVEKKTDKDTILENYLNTINLGAGSYGVQAAARQYFDKDIWDLNLSECATLAGITQNPTNLTRSSILTATGRDARKFSSICWIRTILLRISMMKLLQMMFIPVSRPLRKRTPALRILFTHILKMN